MFNRLSLILSVRKNEMLALTGEMDNVAISYETTGQLSLNSILSLSRPTRDHTGIYACLANNSLGSVNMTARVVVAFPPEIQPDNKRVFRSWDQRPVTLFCRGDLTCF